MDNKISFSLDGVFGALRAVFDFLTSMFRPVSEFMREVAGQGWLGFGLVFMIGFTLILVKGAARSGKGFAIYGGSLEYIGKRGLIACLFFLVLLSIEDAIEPIVTLVVASIGNSLTGQSPGIGQTIVFLLGHSTGRADFLGDLGLFYNQAHNVLPLGFKATFLVGVAFGSMFLVGKAGTSITSRIP